MFECSDCPRADYPTDKTRCAECPYRKNQKYIPWVCADCGEEFFCLHTNGKPPSDTYCVNCGSDATAIMEEDWPAPNSQFGVGS